MKSSFTNTKSTFRPIQKIRAISRFASLESPVVTLKNDLNRHFKPFQVGVKAARTKI